MTADPSEYNDNEAIDLTEAILDAIAQGFRGRKGGGKAQVTVNAKAEFQGDNRGRRTVTFSGVKMDKVREAISQLDRKSSYRAVSPQAQLNHLMKTAHGREIAGELGAIPSKETGRRWANGEQQPGAHYRNAIEMAYNMAALKDVTPEGAHRVADAFSEAIKGSLGADGAEVRLFEIHQLDIKRDK